MKYTRGIFVALLFITFAINVVGGGGCMEKKPLTQEEIQLFQNIEKFNKEHGEKGWGLRNRKIENIKLDGIKLHKSTIRGVEFIDSKITNAEFVDTRFVNCVFNKTDLSNSVLNKCRFEGCTFLEATFHSNSFSDSVFEEITEKSEAVSFRESKFYKCEFARSYMKHFSFHSTEINDTSFIISILTDVTFVNKATGININYIKCLMDGVGFGGNFNKVSFNDSTLNGVSFGDGEMSNINITKGGIGHFAISGNVICSTIKIINVEKIVLLSSVESKLNSIVIENNGVIKYLRFIGANIEGNNIIKGCKNIDVFQLKKSNLKNLTIEDVTFTNEISLQKSSFENFKLNNVRYSDTFKVKKHEQVEYLNSDRFPEK